MGTVRARSPFGYGSGCQHSARLPGRSDVVGRGCRRPRIYIRAMRKASWMRAIRMILAALAFSGVWLWVGDGERILGPLVIVIAVSGLWALSWVGRADK